MEMTMNESSSVIKAFVTLTSGEDSDKLTDEDIWEGADAEWR